MSDKRKPVLEKVGCFYEQERGESGFHFFKVLKVLDNDVFIYNKGILWKLKHTRTAVGARTSHNGSKTKDKRQA